MTGLLNYSSCAKRLGMERIILPLVDYVKHCVNSYPQSYPHNFVMIATLASYMAKVIHIDGARFSLPHQRKLVSDTAKNVLWKTDAILNNVVKEITEKPLLRSELRSGSRTQHGFYVDSKADYLTWIVKQWPTVERMATIKDLTTTGWLVHNRFKRLRYGKWGS